MRILLPVLLAGVLAGCGVQPTGVIDAGEPAEGVPSGGTVYLIASDGQVRGVQRAGLAGGDPQVVVQSLLAGPDEAERAAGFGTAIPGGVTVLDLRFTGATMALTLSADPTGFSERALTQLGCTVLAYGRKAADPVDITLEGAGSPAVRAPDCPAL